MRTTRRSALAASGAVVVAVAGCSADGSEPGSGPSTPMTTSTSPEAAADPDRLALERGFEITSGLAADLEASDIPIVGAGDLAQIHAAHLAALQAAAGAVAPTAEPSAARPLDLARLRRRELAAQRELAALSMKAESGALARLLASMSAGIAAGLSHRGEVPR